MTVAFRHPSYAHRRAQAIDMAAWTDGFGRPPVPEGATTPDRLIPAALARRMSISGGPERYGMVRVGDCAALQHFFGAKERRQNREKF